MQALDLLRKLVAIPSVNPFRYFQSPSKNGSDTFVGLGAEQEINLFIEDWLKSCGFETERQMLHPEVSVTNEDGRTIEIPARWNLIGTRLPEGTWNGSSILFFGHTDTVDVKNGWESDPFTITPRTVDGREFWFGLGSNDMKAGLAAILDAVKNARSKHSAIKVAFLADEEYYSFGADHLCRSSFLGDVSVAIAPEIGEIPYDPSQYQTDHQWIGIGRLGRVEYEFEVFGKACHGSDVFIEEHAVNAVAESARLQCVLAEDCKQVHREYSVNGYSSVVNSAYLSYHTGGEPILSVPDYARFVLDRTLLPDESAEAELTRLQSMVTRLQTERRVDPRAKISVRLKPRPTAPCQPYYFSPELPAIRSVIDAAKRHTTSTSLHIGRGVADENRIAAVGVPTITLGPTGAGSHSALEWVDPTTVTRTALIFRDIIKAA